RLVPVDELVDAVVSRSVLVVGFVVPDHSRQITDLECLMRHDDLDDWTWLLHVFVQERKDTLMDTGSEIYCRLLLRKLKGESESRRMVPKVAPSVLSSYQPCNQVAKPRE